MAHTSATARPHTPTARPTNGHHGIEPPCMGCSASAASADAAAGSAERGCADDSTTSFAVSSDAADAAAASALAGVPVAESTVLPASTVFTTLVGEDAAPWEPATPPGCTVSPEALPAPLSEAVHLAKSLMSPAGGVAKSHGCVHASSACHPANEKPLRAGSAGRVRAWPFVTYAVSTALPPQESNVTFHESAGASENSTPESLA